MIDSVSGYLRWFLGMSLIISGIYFMMLAQAREDAWPVILIIFSFGFGSIVFGSLLKEKVDFFASALVLIVSGYLANVINIGHLIGLHFELGYFFMWSMWSLLLGFPIVSAMHKHFA